MCSGTVCETGHSENSGRVAFVSGSGAEGLCQSLTVNSRGRHRATLQNSLGSANHRTVRDRPIREQRGKIQIIDLCNILNVSETDIYSLSRYIDLV